ncbi:MAG: DNA-binding response regulator [Bacteroidetes bacterium]|jgi:DNA-binding LytR/AlgR family response regulator|nr:DNA-binding response regulator [Bacteroidota bacterium]
MIKAIAIDDELIATKVIENFCKEIDFIELEKTFNESKEGLKYLNKFPVDLVFLDIEMPGLNGIELYKKLKQDTLVIFITSRADYAVEGFNLQATDYLVKPFTFERFVQAVKRANELLNFQSQKPGADNKHIFIRADFSLVKIALDDIDYIEGLDDYLRIHLHNQKSLIARMTLKKMLEKLPGADFLRIHRSFIIPLKKIERIKTRVITVVGKELPVGQSYEEEVAKVLSSK